MATIGEIVRHVFPFGTPSLDDVLRATEARDGRRGWTRPPASPVDLFAVAALLLMRSGAYHHVRTVGATAEGCRSVEVGPDDRERWCRVARDWRARPRTPRAVKDLWSALMADAGEPLFVEVGSGSPHPAWWRPALALMVIADQASVSVGFRNEGTWVNLLYDALILQGQAGDRPCHTLSLADADVACVLPKSHTPSVGCTLRSLSHNLALLPPRGLARARWTKWDTLAPKGSPTDKPLNILLVPYPYALTARHVVQRGAGPGEGQAWGWFSLEPLDAGSPEEDERDLEELVAHVRRMITSAREDVGEVHGLVFPEMSLSRRAYAAVRDLCAGFDDIEFIVAGAFQDATRSGNFAVLTGFLRKDGKVLVTESFQQKHHRWRLDAGQIGGYSLGTRLDPARLWWEDLEITSRSLAVATLRQSTTVTALICEDLARVDPAQEVLRALGPNLVIALLMDGPQLKDRWSARYATVLAEDPGSSVLSFTSLGLIERTNQTGRFEPSRAVALWRDQQGERILKLPHDSPGLLLTISTSVTREATLDGRDDGGNALALNLSGVIPLPRGDGLPRGWVS